jgi:hypothetical protein
MRYAKSKSLARHQASLPGGDHLLLCPNAVGDAELFAFVMSAIPPLSSSVSQSLVPPLLPTTTTTHKECQRPCQQRLVDGDYVLAFATVVACWWGVRRVYEALEPSLIILSPRPPPLSQTYCLLITPCRCTTTTAIQPSPASTAIAAATLSLT